MLLAAFAWRTTRHNNEHKAKSLMGLVVGETPLFSQNMNDIPWLKCVWNKNRCDIFCYCYITHTCLFKGAVSSCWYQLSVEIMSVPNKELCTFPPPSSLCFWHHFHSFFVFFSTQRGKPAEVRYWTKSFRSSHPLHLTKSISMQAKRE